MYGISTINVELTSRCNKDCWMCGRRKLEKEKPDWANSLGDMEMATLLNIANHIDPGMIVQLHWNGEPLLYPNLRLAVDTFWQQGAYVCLDTNGLLLGARAAELENCHSVAISVIEGDTPENYKKQQEQTWLFLDHNPGVMLVVRTLGDVHPEFRNFYEYRQQCYNVVIVRRQLHAAEMSHTYQKFCTKPEIGVCLDLLSHLAIDRFGNVYPCVRFNPGSLNYLGNVHNTPLDQIIKGQARKEIIIEHFAGKRNQVPLCNKCDYWGIPRG